MTGSELAIPVASLLDPDRCVIDLIPNELLLHIFWFGLPPFGLDLPMVGYEAREGPRLVRSYLASMQRINKRWRALCTSAPQLWTSISWTKLDWERCVQYKAHDPLESSLESLDAFRLFCSRSKSLPVHVYLETPYINCLDSHMVIAHTRANLISTCVAIELERHAERVSSMHIVNANEFLWPISAQWTSLFRLTLQCSERSLPVASDPTKIFHFPILEELGIFAETVPTPINETRLNNMDLPALKDVILEGDIMCTLPPLIRCNRLEKLTLGQSQDSWGLEEWVNRIKGTARLKVPHVVVDRIRTFCNLCPILSEALTTLHVTFDPSTPFSWNTRHTLPTFPSLITAIIGAGETSALRFIPQLLLSSPDITTLKCTSLASRWLNDMLLSVSNVLGQHNHSPTSGSRPVASSLQHFVIETDAQWSTEAPSYIQSILDLRPCVKVKLDTSGFENLNKEFPLSQYEALLMEYAERFEFVPEIRRQYHPQCELDVTSNTLAI